MKKLIRGILAVSAMAAALALTGCDKKNGTTTGGDTTFAGEYAWRPNPSAPKWAKDPNATAIEMEGMNMTYAQIIAALFSLTQSADLGGTSDITFQPDGSMVIVFDDPEDGTVTLLPNEAEGIPADAITYALNGSNVIFTLSSETIDNMLDAATDPQEAAAIKQLLAGFNKGIFTYSAADNTAKVTFKYKLTENELTLYIDKGMISETWSAGKAIMNGILALVGEDNPEIAAILTAVIPQVDTMLEGFNKIEVGAKMTRK
ncbi:MAG: hypothetical protein ACLUZZ_04190 [Alistipes inops]